MKKLLALTLTMAMLFTMTAMAEEIKTDSHDVTATYIDNSGNGAIYSVDIVWGSMDFKYYAAGNGTWDPETHSYPDKVETGYWECTETNGDTVKIINHSNAEIIANISFESSVEGSFDQSTLKIKSAVGTEVDEAPSASTKLTLTGAISNEYSNKTSIGSVTITIVEGMSINNITTNSDLSSVSDNGLIIEITGTGLSSINKSDFDNIMKITAVNNNNNNVTELLVNKLNVDYSATENKIIITFKDTLSSWYKGLSELKCEVISTGEVFTLG